MEEELATQINDNDLKRQRLVELSTALDDRQAELGKLEEAVEASKHDISSTEAGLAESYRSVTNREASLELALADLEESTTRTRHMEDTEWEKLESERAALQAQQQALADRASQLDQVEASAVAAEQAASTRAQAMVCVCVCVCVRMRVCLCVCV